MVAVAVDSTGQQRVYGLDRGLQATAKSRATGAAPGDATGYTLTLSAANKNESIILLAPPVPQGSGYRFN
jgi:hypothetical protein